jgi:hypothetical protein
MGLTQILCWNYQGSLKQHVDRKIKEGFLDCDHLRTTTIGKETVDKAYMIGAFPGVSGGTLSEEERDKQIRKAMKDLLGRERKKIKVEE